MPSSTEGYEQGKDLFLADVDFRNFRNYGSFRLDDIGPLTVLVGSNAVGKTNVVEGIQLLTAQTSFRNPTGKQMVKWGEGSARLRARLKSKTRELSLEMRIQEGKRTFQLNGKAKKVQALKGLLPSVVFTPDDLDLVKGSQTGKRAALDALGTQLSANYYVIRKDYEKILQHKNKLLKEECSLSFLESVDETLLTVGSQLYCYRSALFAKLVVELQRYYREITEQREELTAGYVPSWEDYDPEIFASLIVDRATAHEAMASAIVANRDEERHRKRALIGPHADKIEFFLDGKNARFYGSQGQQRSIVLGFKLSEVAMIQTMLDQKPLLLLDDVMSELDERRRIALIGFISGDIQTFITTTNLQYFNESLLAQARVVELGDSKREREEGAGGEETRS